MKSKRVDKGTHGNKKKKKKKGLSKWYNYIMAHLVEFALFS